MIKQKGMTNLPAWNEIWRRFWFKLIPSSRVVNKPFISFQDFDEFFTDFWLMSFDCFDFQWTTKLWSSDTETFRRNYDKVFSQLFAFCNDYFLHLVKLIKIKHLFIQMQGLMIEFTRFLISLSNLVRLDLHSELNFWFLLWTATTLNKSVYWLLPRSFCQTLALVTLTQNVFFLINFHKETIVHFTKNIKLVRGGQNIKIHRGVYQ